MRPERCNRFRPSLYTACNYILGKIIAVIMDKFTYVNKILPVKRLIGFDLYTFELQTRLRPSESSELYSRLSADFKSYSFRRIQYEFEFTCVCNVRRGQKKSRTTVPSSTAATGNKSFFYSRKQLSNGNFFLVRARVYTHVYRWEKFLDVA